ncbi:MerR family transcriptional regulator [Flagellimonas meishanensis]|uniref:MerR family transcriptional regulator n=1 Tax=Flagellimonas meishanensis TaxID=2873264 RepID=UPI001CA745C2|nr:MerR family transcriptional regulator [[Muricauda] meishanensis]
MGRIIPLGGDDLIIAYSKYFHSARGKEISNHLNTPRIKLSEKVSSRIINHWESEGIIDDNRINGKGWRIYSPMEIIWLEIVKDLRRFNLPLACIKNLRSSLTFSSEKLDYSVFPLLEMFVVQTLSNPKPIYLVVLSDGSGEVNFKWNIESTKEIGLIGSHISISLVEKIRKLFPSIPNSFTTKEIAVDEAEADLLVMLRSGLFKTIVTKTKDGKINRIEAEEILQNKTVFNKILNEYTHQRIETIVENGHVVGYIRKVKTKY